jgi:pimeloyl-ACP methyl ester carboxylesterase
VARAFVNGVRLAYQQLGAGPALVLVHGLAANRAFWYLGAAQAFKAAFQVTLYDLRGHGLSEIAPTGYTPREMADDLGGLLDHLGIEQAVLIGHSYGGVVALHYAAQHPERVVGLVVADSRVNTLQPVQRLGDSPYLSRFERAVIDASGADWSQETQVGIRFLEEVAQPRHRELRMQAGSWVPFGGPRGSEREAERWLELLSGTTARRDFCAPVDLTPAQLRRVATRVLLVYGERSRCLPSCVGLASLLGQAKTVIVPGAGHFHPVTQPREFLGAVFDFLGEPPVPRPLDALRAARRRRVRKRLRMLDGA